jgi:hypothetical protein
LIPTETKQPEAKKTTTPKPKPEPVQAVRVSKRQWAKIVKKPSSYKGDRYVIDGQVTQFDSATGDDNFLADTAHRNTMSYGFFDGENTLLTGSAKQLDDLVEDDVFRGLGDCAGEDGLRHPDRRQHHGPVARGQQPEGHRVAVVG